MNEPTYLYRCFEQSTSEWFDISGLDISGLDISGPQVRVYIHSFRVQRETLCGYWIEDGRKWVSKTGRKRYAFPTIQEARSALDFESEHNSEF